MIITNTGAMYLIMIVQAPAAENFEEMRTLSLIHIFDAGRGVNRQSLGGFQKRMHRLIGGGDARKGGLGHFRGRELLGGKTRLKLANAHFSESTRH